MGKTCVGIDIGTCQLKLAVCSGGTVRQIVVEDMPDNLVREGRVISPEAMAELIRKTAAGARITTRKCAVVLPASAVFTRTMTVPMMTQEQLKINLPYEFRDFITQEKDKYFYDYAIMDTLYDEEGKPQELELIAAAALKETIKSYSDMCRRARLKLVTAIPEELGYMNMIRRMESQNSDKEEREYCFIDLGHTVTKMYIYRGIKHQATRVVEFGMQRLDAVIAEALNTDEHLARVHKHANNNNELTSEACMNIYSTISVELMRAINFYRYNSPNSNLQEVFLCGGGARIEPLAERIAADLAMPVHNAAELLPDSSENADVSLCLAAIGAAMQ